MATIKISHPHHLSVEEAKRRITAAFGPYSGKYHLKQHWEGDRLVVSGPADGHADVSAGSVELELKLGLGASMFKGRVEAAIRSELDAHLKA